MDRHDMEICGFLDVKSTGNRCIAQKVRKKTLVSSKVWKRLWCSMKKLGPSLGVQVQFNSKFSCSNIALKKSEKDNSVIIPSNAILYRVRSKTKQFAFGISPTKDRKPLLSLSANSETETQRWMANIRHLLKPRRHCCMEQSYNVSMVDNAHSKAAGLTGLYGDLIANERGIFIKSVHTSEIIETFGWKEFSQFHLTTAGRPEDVKRICVIHTTKEFRSSVGELYIFCLDANKLLQNLVTQGRGPKHRQKSLNSENLEALMQHDNITSSPQQANNMPLHTVNIETNQTSICNKAIENIYQSTNLALNEEIDPYSYRESNLSIASGIYEEIGDDIYLPKSRPSTSNVYEDIDKIFYNLEVKPPLLPPRPRQKAKCIKEISKIDMGQCSQAENSDSDRRLQNVEICIEENTVIENSSYVPLSPQLRDINIFKADLMETGRENDYVIMR